VRSVKTEHQLSFSRESEYAMTHRHGSRFFGAQQRWCCRSTVSRERFSQLTLEDIKCKHNIMSLCQKTYYFWTD